MEKIIGILEEESEYPRRLARYINNRHDIGCAAVAFKNMDELSVYGRKSRLPVLLVGNAQAWNEEKVQKLSAYLTPDGTLWQLAEERAGEDAALLYGVFGVFRYQRAEAVIQRLLGCVAASEGIQGGLYTVYSPISNTDAEEFAWSLAKELKRYGRTLFIPWEPFGAFGRREGEALFERTLSEFLYMQRGQREQTKELFSGLPAKEGVEYIPSVDYYADLWQYSAEELPAFLETCKAAGCRNVVFLAGFFSEGIEAVMEQSEAAFLVMGTGDGAERRKQEFFRQMKYAGKQTLLSQMREVYGTDGGESLRQLKKEQEVQWKK